MRVDVVSAAVSQIGNPDTDLIWRAVLKISDYRAGIDKAWCGAFALKCLHDGGVAQSLCWQWGLGFLEINRFPKTLSPEPGDIAYYDHPYQHHAIVERVDGDLVHTIGGNQGNGIDHMTGKIGTTVRRVVRKISAGIYYSIAPFLPKTEPAPNPIAAAQHALNLAMNPGDTLLIVNGELDDPTRTAIYWFQRLHGLKVTGELDDATIKGLGL